MSELTFREIDHTYWLGSRRVFGVTEIFHDNRLIKGEDFFTEFGRERGHMVHLACDLLAWDNLDWDSLDPMIYNYVLSCARYFEHVKAIPRRTEHRAYHPLLYYAGTWDWDGADFQRDDLLLDYKSGGEQDWHKWQTAAYQELAIANRIPIEQRGTLYLQKDGSMAKLKLHRDRNDFKIFVSALNMTMTRAAA